MNINLYVDDLRINPDGFLVARSYEDAIIMLKRYNINILSLDHDLGLDLNGDLAKTGYDLVKYICQNEVNIKKIYIHTDNPVGRENMYKTLLGAKKHGLLNEDLKIYPYPIVPNRYE